MPAGRTTRPSRRRPNPRRLGARAAGLRGEPGAWRRPRPCRAPRTRPPHQRRWPAARSRRRAAGTAGGTAHHARRVPACTPVRQRRTGTVGPACLRPRIRPLPLPPGAPIMPSRNGGAARAHPPDSVGRAAGFRQDVGPLVRREPGRLRRCSGCSVVLAVLGLADLLDEWQALSSRPEPYPRSVSRCPVVSAGAPAPQTASSSAISSAVRTRSAAATESRIVSGRLDPGMGTTTGDLASIQARQTCCGLTPWASATRANGA